MGSLRLILLRSERGWGGGGGNRVIAQRYGVCLAHGQYRMDPGLNPGTAYNYLAISEHRARSNP